MNRRLTAAVLVLSVLGPAVRADEPSKPVSYQVPFRLAATKHIVVRARINGKGPFNLVVDTGAPALYLTQAVVKKVGAAGDKNGWSSFDRFELEGGLVIPKVRARAEDLFQLESMNGLGAAGFELHGLLGYNVLARYRIEYDLSRDKMTWTPVDHKPALPLKMGKGAPGNLDAMGSILKTLGFLMGRSANPPVLTRGFLGVELSEANKEVTIQAVLAGSPAATGGLKPGDRVVTFQDKPVGSLADLYKLAEKLRPDNDVNVGIRRNGKAQTIAFKAGRGL